jgi:hypothetical protein
MLASMLVVTTAAELVELLVLELALELQMLDDR